MIHTIVVLLLTWLAVTVVLIAYNAAEDPEYHFDEPEDDNSNT